MEIDARRVGLVQEFSRIANALESLEHELGMVELLETDDVRVVSDDLLQHPPSSEAPVECFRQAPDKVVILGAEGLGQDVPLEQAERLPEEERGLDLGELSDEGLRPVPEMVITQSQEGVA